MASTFDVAGRLAEGDRALTALDDYVAACEVLGMPASASLLELYRAESGLDLAALAADARSLEAAAVVAQDALRLQGNGYRELTAQWSGTGGDAAADFLRTMTVAAEDVVAHLQRSAQALTALRDELWRAVDTKVDAVLRADAQAAGHRDEWSAAARAVLGGAGDVATASEIVDQQLKPFVLRVVFGDLLPALWDASEAVAAGYDSAIGAVTPASVSFAVPVVVTPEWAPPPSLQPTAAPMYQAAATAPFGTLGTAASLAPPATPAPSVTPAGAPAAPEPALGTAAVPEPALGAATPAAAGIPGDLGLGSSVGGLGQQLADAVGGALGSMAGLGPDSSGFSGLDEIKDGLGDDLGLDDDVDTAEDDDVDPDEDEEKKEADGEDETDETDEGADKVAPDADEQAVEPPPSDPVQPSPAPTLPPPPAAPPVEPVAQQEDPATKTPCQIAADQLPMVGD
ncbi:hypothetical protein [Mycolicibacterium llatzerense]|uniref:hypothetical protein n=1 Tax=Mycolicibacterium llatzerense TaxID=280871 RepID=UPI0021B5B712|nr:hypothetical protein [Mycolicibacterium llatzerense]MCT7363740.1 hypothetical protein [Mycolicibacterium llatzerense]MCT7367891.1 hypothetical protein [Mycolicibacterium llatzerense]